MSSTKSAPPSRAVRTPAPAVRHNAALTFYENFSLRAKIVSIVVAFALVTSIVAAISISAVKSAVADTETLATMENDVAFKIGAVHQEELKSRMLIAMAAAMPLASASDVAVWTDKMAATDADLKAGADGYEAGIARMGAEGSSLGQADWQGFKTAWADWKNQRDTAMLNAVKSSDAVAFSAAVTAAQPALDEAIARLEAEEKLVNAEATAIASQSASGGAAVIRTSLIALVVGLIVVVLLALFAAEIMRRQVARVKRVADALASGDFTAVSGMDTRDEVGRMGHALDIAADSLRATMQRVAGSATSVAAAAQQLSASNDQVTAGADEMSARAGVVSTAASEVSRNLGDVSRGSEEMAAAIREIAHSTNEAARVGLQAVEAARAANEQLDRLSNSSNEIGNVVKVITQIAGQTNLLALNATIEAVALSAATSSQVLGQVSAAVSDLRALADELKQRVASFTY